MGVFGGGMPTVGGYAEAKQLQPCKPEYEKMIADVKKQQEASQKLYNALLHYLDTNGGGNDAQSSHLIGSLILEMRDQDKIIQRIIEQQELEK